jgi:septum formation protein
MERIVLASRSPRRKQLLEWAEIDFEVIVKETDETFPPGMPLEEAAIHIARSKALAVSSSYNITLPILSADTIVVCDRQLIGKPKDRSDAIRILKLLSGKDHQVITGVCIYTPEKEVLFSDTTAVSFNDISREEIEHYIDKYKPYDKAGAYAIQEWIGVVGIRSINGDFYNVMGLPVNRVVKELKSF